MSTAARMVIAAAAIGAIAGGAGAVPPPGRVERIERHDPSSPPARGPASAPVTIELFFVPSTNLAHTPAIRQLERLQAEHPTRIRIIYRIVKRGAQQMLPTAALEAHAEGKFFDFMDALNAYRCPPRSQPCTTTLSKEQLIELAVGVGLDRARLSDAINHRFGDVLEANERRFDRLHGGTFPSALFNDKVPHASLTSNTIDLRHEYEDAYERALDLIDRGVDPRHLMEAFDAEAISSAQPAVTISPVDDFGEGAPPDQVLASPPLDLTGMPSLGKPGVEATVPVVVLCRPNDPACGSLLRIVHKLVDYYPEDVRIVWAPWFDVTRDDASELSMLADAALCAEAIGSSEDLEASGGWRWIINMYEQSNRMHGRHVAADRTIDAVAAALDLDPKRLSACRAKTASTALDWITAARHSGVTRSPAIVIGGRIYNGLNDQGIIQKLVEAELAPGVLAGLAPAGQP